LALRLDRAVSAWNQAVAVDAYNGWARIQVASVRRVQGRHAEAVEHIKRALEVEREDTDADAPGPGRRTRRSFRWFKLIAARLAWGLLLLDEDRRAEARDELIQARELISRADHFHRAGFLACVYRGLEELARRRGLQGELNDARRGARAAEQRLMEGSADEIDGACRVADAYRIFFPRRSLGILQPHASGGPAEMRPLLAYAQAAVRALDIGAARTALERLYEASTGQVRAEAVFLLQQFEEGMSETLRVARPEKLRT
jgi:tetratricopeptide (TPR) repeat protein